MLKLFKKLAYCEMCTLFFKFSLLKTFIIKLVSENIKTNKINLVFMYVDLQNLVLTSLICKITIVCHTWFPQNFSLPLQH